MDDKERAKKLAAAKKKLKAYQSAEKQSTVKDHVEEKTKETIKLQNYFTNNDVSNDFLVPEQESENETTKKKYIEPLQGSIPTTTIATETTTTSTVTVIENENISNSSEKPFQDSISNQINTMFNTSHLEKEKNQITEKFNATTSNSSELLKTIKILISEKADLSKESSRLQISCKEKDFEIEEIKTRLKGSTKRIEELEQYYFNEQKKNSGTVEQVKTLESDLNKYKSQSEEFF